MEPREKTLDLNNRLHRSLGRQGRVFGVTLKVTKEERSVLEMAAKQESEALGEWARGVLLREARSQVNERALFTEVVALRMLLNTTLRFLATGQTMPAAQFDQIAREINTKKHDKALEVREQYQPTGAR